MNLLIILFNFNYLVLFNAHKLFCLGTEIFTIWKEVSFQFRICACIKCMFPFDVYEKKKQKIYHARYTTDSCNLAASNCNISIPHIRRSRLFGYFQFRAYAMPRGLTCSSLMGARIYFRQA